MTVENMKTGFVERIGGTIFVVNAMPAENAKHMLMHHISKDCLSLTCFLERLCLTTPYMIE